MRYTEILNNSIIFLLSVYIIFYASDLSKGYPLKLVEILNEKIIILLIIAIQALLISIKKYTVAILFMIFVMFVYLHIPLLTETFVDIKDLDEILDKRGKEVLEDIDKLSNVDILKNFDLDFGKKHIQNLDNITDKLEKHLEEVS